METRLAQFLLMPVIAVRVLHGGPNTLGILMTATGVGALIGTAYLAARHSVVGSTLAYWAS